MSKQDVKYSLYLVTDSTPAILGDKDICHVVEEALKGGVTVVQYRDKESHAGILISTAKKLHAITTKYSVPLLINDRVDVALAIGCEGVHIGQDDMDIATARKLLGPSAIIGVTAGTENEAITAIEGGADYIGIGTVFSTATKKDTKNILGTFGVRQILQSAAGQKPERPRVVCIGGIGPSNVQRVLVQASAPEWPLDGVAVVSAIMGSQDPQEASRKLSSLIATPAFSLHAQEISDPQALVEKAPGLLKAVEKKRPISHNMTNLVVQNFAANVALAIGASPIMSSYGAEAADLAKLGGALVINSGTVTPDALENYVQAVQAYNAAKRPVILDPVGAGASAIRREALHTLLDSGYFTVIKGNKAEILEVFHAREPDFTKRQQQQGVDSNAEPMGLSELFAMLKSVATRESCVVLMTGVVDYISDGTTTLKIKNGHEYLGQVTGTGCVLGTTISAYLAAREEDESVLGSVLAAMLHFEAAAEIAVNNWGLQRLDRPGSFVAAFLDALAWIRMGEEAQLVHHAKVELWNET